MKESEWPHTKAPVPHTPSTTPTTPNTGNISERLYATPAHDGLPFLSKLESLAGSAVRAAGRVQADMIIVYTATGGNCSLFHQGLVSSLHFLIPPAVFSRWA